MKSDHPRVSVIMPINRDDGFFEAAVNSVLNQTFENFEFLIIANNCTDELWQKILKVQDTRVITKRVSVGGLCFSPNYGLILARGDYIARMDADDIALPNRLELQVNFLDENPQIDVVGGKVTLIGSAGQLLSDTPKFYETHEQIISVLPYRNPLTQPAVCMRKAALLDVGGYKFGFTGEDYELWLRLMMAGKRFHNLDQELLLYRRHDLQMTSAAKNYVIFCEVSSMLFMYFLKTKQLKFFLGAVLQIPLLRRVKNFIKKAKL
jgi:glycosyltransferase involved in cell wall biosynthesis